MYLGQFGIRWDVGNAIAQECESRIDALRSSPLLLVGRGASFDDAHKRHGPDGADGRRALAIDATAGIGRGIDVDATDRGDGSVVTFVVDYFCIVQY